jgi:glucose-6-phosphate dehydrogenase assembly protein OpcA
MDRLEEKGWDLQSRLYLGFSSRRIQWTFKED